MRGHRGRHGQRPDLAVARGNVRGLLLAGLLEGAAHGYELMRRLEQRSGGRWRPSPGSVYPLLQALVGEGLVTGQDEGGRKVYALTEQGRGLADASGLHELATGGGDAPHHDLHDEVKQLHLAARQVGTVGGSDQVDQAVEIVRGARQALYRLLAEQ